MLHGTLWDKIPRFAIPVAATAILSQLFNAADIAVIGNFTGELRTVAVAAVGTNSSIISLIVNLFIGIALGANVTIAHAIGEKNDTMVHHAVHTSIVVAVLRKFVLLLPLIYLMPHLMADKTMAVYTAEPVADAIAVTCTAILFGVQFRKALKKVEQET